jgi:alkanesulfonate monooxygenase SsuD/methylene tetrahydromethanopterin reductase-like flavin-dependent oxidoreductase (luciferase family)
LITVGAPHEHLRRMVDAYREAGGRGPLRLQVHLSYAADDDEALRIAHDQWRTNVFAPPVCWDLELVEHFEEVAKQVPPEAMHDVVRISADPARHAAWLQEYADLGFDEIMLHHVGQEQDEFIDVFGAKVLPQLRGGAS